MLLDVQGTGIFHLNGCTNQNNKIIYGNNNKVGINYVNKDTGPNNPNPIPALAKLTL
jgi:hypothetical protein